MERNLNIYVEPSAEYCWLLSYDTIDRFARNHFKSYADAEAAAKALSLKAYTISKIACIAVSRTVTQKILTRLGWHE